MQLVPWPVDPHPFDEGDLTLVCGEEIAVIAKHTGIDFFAEMSRKSLRRHLAEAEIVRRYQRDIVHPRV